MVKKKQTQLLVACQQVSGLIAMFGDVWRPSSYTLIHCYHWRTNLQLPKLFLNPLSSCLPSPCLRLHSGSRCFDNTSPNWAPGFKKAKSAKSCLEGTCTCSALPAWGYGFISTCGMDGQGWPCSRASSRPCAASSEDPRCVAGAASFRHPPTPRLAAAQRRRAQEPRKSEWENMCRLGIKIANSSQSL